MFDYTKKNLNIKIPHYEPFLLKLIFKLSKYIFMLNVLLMFRSGNTITNEFKEKSSTNIRSLDILLNREINCAVK